jgi:hypothetical protein
LNTDLISTTSPEAYTPIVHPFRIPTSITLESPKPPQNPTADSPKLHRLYSPKSLSQDLLVPVPEESGLKKLLTTSELTFTQSPPKQVSDLSVPSDSVTGLMTLDYAAIVNTNSEHHIIPHRDIARFRGLSSIVNSFSTPPIPAPPPSAEQLESIHVLLEHDLLEIACGIDIHEFIALTIDHPNPQLIASIVRGLANGFSSNIREFPSSLASINKNHPSATNSTAFAKNMTDEIEAGRRIAIPLVAQEKLPYLNSNPAGVLNKKGKARVINDKSYPRGFSINDHILGSDYGRLVMDDTRACASILREFAQKGERIMLGTEDISKFYRNLPVAGWDQLYQLIDQDGVLYLDRAEVFGDRGAPFKACFLADVICWILENKFGLMVARHFVDNFLYYTLPHRAKRDQAMFLLLFKRLNIPLNDKDRQLGTIIKHLGFIVNTTSYTIEVPQTTRLEIASIINSILKKGGLSIQDLESVNGKLVWLCAVVPIAWVYAKVIWSCLTVAKDNRKSRYVKLSSFPKLQSTLSWFADLLVSWCGISYNMETRWIEASPADLSGVAGDASDRGGAFVTPDHYSFWKWCPHCLELINGNVSILELATVLIGYACKIGGLHSGKLILWLSDNSGGISNYNKGYGDDPLLSEIIAELRFELIRSQVDNFRLVWVSRKSLYNADLLSRGSLIDEKKFLSIPGNESRSYVAPFSTRSVVILDKTSKPYVYGFSRFHDSS